MKGQYFRVLFLSIFIVIVGCKGSGNAGAKKTIAKQQIENLNTGVNEEDGKIVFLTFGVILADSLNDVYKFRLLDRKLIEGTLKKPAFQEKRPIQFEPFYLYCELLDDQNTVLDAIRTEDPLMTAYEFINEVENYDRAVVRKKEGDFTIRFSSGKKLKKLRIWKFSENANKEKLLYEAIL